MTKRVVHPDGVPTMVHLSSAIAAGDLLFVSGQTARDVVGFEPQTRAVFEKLGAILRAAGVDFSAVVRCGVYLSDIRYRTEMNRVYLQFSCLQAVWLWL